MVASHVQRISRADDWELGLALLQEVIDDTGERDPDETRRMMLATGDVVTLGRQASSRLRFPTAPSTFEDRRLLLLDGEPAFELSLWCGTCPLLFERLTGGAATTLSLPQLQERLNHGLDDLDEDVVAEFGTLLPAGRYLPLLLEVQPTLVRPGDAGDYFQREQVATWGLDGSWGLPHNPNTLYYRTHESHVDAVEHLFEFIVPMVPPTWNDRARVDRYREHLAESTTPTMVAVSMLDICEPAYAPEDGDGFAHWGLMHFMLDGHHKLEAAACDGRRLRLLSLLSLDASLATEGAVARVPLLRAAPRAPRSA